MLCQARQPASKGCHCKQNATTRKPNLKNAKVPSPAVPGEVPLPYNPALDGLRAISILAVLGFHCEVPLLHGGFFGVDLFFVLSGFLITTMLRNELDETNSIDLGRFYWNRLVRLTPPLYLMLAAILLIGLETPRKIFIAAVYLTDFFAPYEHFYGVLRHTWSLAVEEQFYLVWPLLLVGILRLPRPAAVVVAMFCIATAWRIVLLQELPSEWVYYRPDARLTGLLAGAIVALAKPEFKDLSQLDSIGRTAAGTILPFMVGTQIFTPVSLLIMQPLVEVSAAALVVVATDSRSEIHRLLSHPMLVRVGVLSYSIYLWHYPIANVMKQSYGWAPTLFVTAVLSMALAVLTHSLVEIPMRALRLRRRVVVG
ncbi:MAG: acyltransferase [Mesorhizobium sp.]|nr:acyltransferase [Mesorhizobium sp. M4B.F.Ca.ET.049.02.1.2]RVD21896.1 acyltransferase [Mesorhizobium sp. M4B.F.Ca.ET.017.02.2.1]RWC95372.1 MAG: acyltransferase [Mesorhizobium sp.]TGV27139.1 acyltransferase [Mesorhizobium sp. M4B.F.Ca.ET.143.01.1.1]TIW71616.1 MAG: acyltransferase [Mesorhizobium sp.]